MMYNHRECIWITHNGMKREKRHKEILTLLDERDRIDVEELAVFFNVSTATIRRDLFIMSEQGLVRKVHGGVAKFQTAHENLFATRSLQSVNQKIAIARYATRFVETGDTLFTNAGTTTALFARELVKVSNELMVITNSAEIAHEYWNNGQGDNRVYLLGGYYNGDEIETNGISILEQIERFRADHAFLTVGTVHAMQGFMDYRLEAAAIIKVMMQQARRTTVLADSSKLDQVALVSIFELGAVDRLVTDSLPSEQLADALAEASTQLHIAEPVG